MEYEYKTGGPRRSIQICDWSISILVFNSQVMYCMHKQWIFFIKLLKSSRSHDFLKQIELDDTVDSMTNFQELHSAEHDK